LHGVCSDLYGDCSGVTGTCTGLRGDCTDLRGDLSRCSFWPDTDIETLVAKGAESTHMADEQLHRDEAEFNRLAEKLGREV
jgi:hypothetical protein